MANLDVSIADVRLKAPFRISGRTFQSAPVVKVRFERNGFIGRGEASGVYYMGDTPQNAAEVLTRIAGALRADITREELRAVLPAGGARNALDCALWELESREQDQPVWSLAGLPAPRRLLTTITLSAEDPLTMANSAIEASFAKALKLKLTGEVDLDIERVRAVRSVRADVWIAVDANQGYEPATLGPLLPVLMDCGVSLLEQPFKRGAEAQLEGLSLPLPVAADESCLNLAELETLPGRFDVVNIKLDKCGGLTEGLMMARRAEELGLKVMVGNMMGGSLSTAPGFVLGQLCDVVDLDGPFFLAEDPAPRVSYADGHIWCPPDVWGPRASPH